MNLINTIKGSMLEHFYPDGWDLEKMDRCVGSPKDVLERQAHWNKEFTPVMSNDIADLNVLMGHEIATQIRELKEAGRKCALILPVGPMGMYRWVVYFLTQWKTHCDHVTTFNMDEWADAQGNTLAPDDPAAFQNAMNRALFDPLGEYTVPQAQRNFATLAELPLYAHKIAALKKEGAKLVLVYGIGRMCHIAFWEPHFAGEYADIGDWKRATHRIGAKLHPLTIEQNAITSFKSRTTQVPAFANTIGPGLFLQADYAIGGADGAFSRDMQWQGLSFWTTLRYGPTKWIPSAWMPTMPGKLFFDKALAGPLVPECN